MKFPFDRDLYPNCFNGHQYALDIIARKIPANIWVISACERYLDDLDFSLSDPIDCSFYFDVEKAERYLRIVQQMHHAVGDWDDPCIIYEPWQCFAWMNIKGFISYVTEAYRFRTIHLDVARGNAKALDVDTLIPTPEGLIPLKDLSIGDLVFNRQGNVCRIVNETPIHFPKSYKITFDRDKVLYASDKHLWFIDDNVARKKKAKEFKEKGFYTESFEEIRETQDLINDVSFYGVSNFSVAMTDPVGGYLEAFSDMGPYLKGHLLAKNFESPVYNFKNLMLEVWTLTYEAKIKFLQGVLDTIGRISLTRGRIFFLIAGRDQAREICALISLLGYKVSYKNLSGFRYEVTFLPVGGPKLFTVQSKLQGQRLDTNMGSHSYYHYISDMVQVESRPMKCIQVDSPDGSFLCTEYAIPTHNSTMASQCGLFDLCCDKPNGNRIYCAATSRQQAGEVLEGARIMALKNPSFRNHFGIEVRANEILHPASNSFVKSISAQANNADGKIGKTIITDELHAMQRKLFETLISGQSKRRDSQLLAITTAGYQNDGIGASQRSYAKKVALGDIEDDTFFSLVYGIDDVDHNKIWQGSHIWIKANPNYGVSVDTVNFEAQAKKAQSNPEDKSGFMIKHLNVYLGEMLQYYDVKKWEALRDKTLKWEDFKGEKCMVGIDIASKVDLTSICYIFKRNGLYYPFFKNYVPEVRLELPSRQRYKVFVEEKDLIPTPGEAINLIKFYDSLVEDLKDIDPITIQADPWNASELITKLSMAQYDVSEFRMSTGNLSEPMKTLDAIIKSKELRHNTGSMLSWCLGNVLGKPDAADNVFPRKGHDDNKIDPIISALMALAAWLVHEEKESCYEVQEIRIL